MTGAKDVLKRWADLAYGVPPLKNLIPDAVWVKSGVLDPFVTYMRTLNLPSAARGGSEPRVLFLRMRVVPRLTTFELVLAKQLAEEGAAPVFAFCDPVLPVCNGWDVREPDGVGACRRCSRMNQRLAQLMPWTSLFLQGFVLESDQVDAASFARGIDIEDLKSLTVEGHDLGNEMYRSLAKFLFIGTVPATDENRALARKFAEAAFILVRGLTRLLDDVQPETVVLNCGHIMWYGIAHKLLTERGVRVVTFDETNIAVTHLTWEFDDVHPCVDHVWDSLWEERRQVPLTPHQRNRILELLDERRRRFLYKRTSEYEAAPELADLSKYSKVFTLFTNVPWDATIVGKDIVFDSMQDWVAAAVDVASVHPDSALIVRVHPAEAGVYGMVSRERVANRLQERYGTLPANVIVIDSSRRVNSYDLIARSDGVLAYCSNVGLEAVLMGKPAMVSGAAHFRGKGLTRDVESPDEFMTEFDRWFLEVPEAPDTEQALRYAHLAYIETQIQLHLFKDEHPFLVEEISVSDFREPYRPELLRVVSALSDWVRSPDGTRGVFTNDRIVGVKDA